MRAAPHLRRSQVLHPSPQPKSSPKQVSITETIVNGRIVEAVRNRHQALERALNNRVAVSHEQLHAAIRATGLNICTDDVGRFVSAVGGEDVPGSVNCSKLMQSLLQPSTHSASHHDIFAARPGQENVSRTYKLSSPEPERKQRGFGTSAVASGRANASPRVGQGLGHVLSADGGINLKMGSSSPKSRKMQKKHIADSDQKVCSSGSSPAARSSRASTGCTNMQGVKAALAWTSGDGNRSASVQNIRTGRRTQLNIRKDPSAAGKRHQHKRIHQQSVSKKRTSLHKSRQIRQVLNQGADDTFCQGARILHMRKPPPPPQSS